MTYSSDNQIIYLYLETKNFCCCCCREAEKILVSIENYWSCCLWLCNFFLPSKSSSWSESRYWDICSMILPFYSNLVMLHHLHSKLDTTGSCTRYKSWDFFAFRNVISRKKHWTVLLCTNINYIQFNSNKRTKTSQLNTVLLSFSF